MSPFKIDFDVFSKSGRVVVPDGLGVSKTLQQWIGLQDLLSDEVVARLVHSCQVLHDQLGGLSLPCTRLPAGNIKENYKNDAYTVF